MLKGQHSLLTLPKQDEETFLLVQLPDSLPIETLLQTASFVSHKSNAQACLVTDMKSFALSRVETSNALVLVPPQSTVESLEWQHEHQPPPRKKQMTSKGVELTTTPCRLLGAGSGAHFLELKERHLDIKDLDALLSTYDPYNPEAACEGISLDHLAQELQLSKAQVKIGLKELRAFEHQSKYSLLSEEAWQDARRAILSALTECDDFGNYAQDGVNRDDMIRESRKRVTEIYPQVEDALRLVVSSMTRKEEGARCFVDFDKVRGGGQCACLTSRWTIIVDHRLSVFLTSIAQVAIFVAHELFAKPIWSHEALLKEWQARVPGVGDDYKLNAETLLQGVAIRTTNGEWQYLPAEKLAKSAVDRLRQLFDARATWTRRDLDPYLNPLTTNAVGVDEILIKHAFSSSTQVDGATITVYFRKHE